MFTPSFDKVVSTIVGLGVPGMLFLIFLGGAGGLAAGAAGITAALSAFGPGGMVGGLISLPVAVLISKGISEYGIEKILGAVLKEMQKQGKTKEELFDKIENYPVSQSLKTKLKNKMEEVYDFENAVIKENVSEEKEVKEDQEKLDEEIAEIINEEVEPQLEDLLMEIIIQNTPHKITDGKTEILEKSKLEALKKEIEQESSSQESNLSRLLDNIFLKTDSEDMLSYKDYLQEKYNNWIFGELEIEEEQEEIEELKKMFSTPFEEFLNEADFTKYYEIMTHTATD